MKERDIADMFSHDVDDLLSRAGKLTVDTEPALKEYDNVLDLSHDLAVVDFSSESRVKTELRQQLMEKIAAREQQRAKLGIMETIMRTISKRRKPITAFGVLALGVLSLHLCFPGALSAAVKSASDFIEHIGLKHSTVIHTKQAQEASAEPVEEESRGGTVLYDPAATPEENKKRMELYKEGTRHCDSLDDVREALKGTKLHAPTYLPEGFEFNSGDVTPFYGSVTLTYRNSETDNTIWIDEYPTNTVFDREIKTTRSITKVEVNREPACWIDSLSELTWDTEDTHYSMHTGYTIGSPAVDPFRDDDKPTPPFPKLDEFIKIAESIK